MLKQLNSRKSVYNVSQKIPTIFFVHNFARYWSFYDSQCVLKYITLYKNGMTNPLQVSACSNDCVTLTHCGHCQLLVANVYLLMSRYRVNGYSCVVVAGRPVMPRQDAGVLMARNPSCWIERRPPRYATVSRAKSECCTEHSETF